MMVGFFGLRLFAFVCFFCFSIFGKCLIFLHKNTPFFAVRGAWKFIGCVGLWVVAIGCGWIVGGCGWLQLVAIGFGYFRLISYFLLDFPR